MYQAQNWLRNEPNYPLAWQNARGWHHLFKGIYPCGFSASEITIYCQYYISRGGRGHPYGMGMRLVAKPQS